MLVSKKASGLGLTMKQDSEKIISNVSQVNRVIYDVMQMIRGEIMILPCVDTGHGEEKVDPLRDERVAQLLKKTRHGALLYSMVI